MRAPARALFVQKRPCLISSPKLKQHHWKHPSAVSKQFIHQTKILIPILQLRKMSSSHFSTSSTQSHITKTEIEELIKQHKKYFSDLHENKLTENDTASGLPYYLIDVRQLPEIEDTGTIDHSAIHIPCK